MRIQPLLRILLAAATAAVPAVGLAPHPAQAAPADCATTTPATVAGYLDTAMPRLLSEHRVPGAVVSVVSSGQTVFAKGYGVADTARGTPFDASGTLVQVGSVTKLFTWTAVMQQVEAGRLDLHADVNRYLKGFQLPATFPEPVTLLDLMDHTAGFEDSTIGSYARTAADVPPLRDYLASHVPARIRPPGQISAYSNYGAGLAGYIVAQVSGEPYDEYVRRHLLDPLGMSRSTVSQPVPAALAGDLAQSYDSDADPPAPIPLRYDNTPPDGALSTTAMDMANFMTAELDGGARQRSAGAGTKHERPEAAQRRARSKLVVGDQLLELRQHVIGRAAGRLGEGVARVARGPRRIVHAARTLLHAVCCAAEHLPENVADAAGATRLVAELAQDLAEAAALAAEHVTQNVV